MGDPLPPGAIARLGTVRLRHGSTVTGLAFLPDGTLLSASYDKTLRLWEPGSGRELRRFTGPPIGSIFQLSVARDGKTFAALDFGTVYVGTISSGKLSKPAFQSGDTSTSVALSADGQILAAASGKTFQVRLWDLRTGKRVQRCTGHQAMVDCLALSPDGRYLASGAQDGTMRLWDLASGKELFQGKDNTLVGSVAFSPNGKVLATLGGDSKLRLREVPNGKLLHELGGHHVGAIAFSPDSQRVAVSGQSPISVYEVATGKRVQQIQENGYALAFSRDGKTLASSGHDSTIRLWDLATGKEHLPAAGHQEKIRTLSVSGDGRFVATTGGGGGTRVIRLWDARTGREVRQFRDRAAFLGSVALSADGKVVASDRTLWDRASGKVLGRLQDQDYSIEAITFSPDSQTLATATRDVHSGKGRMIRLWQVPGGKEKKHFGDQAIQSLGFSPDGKVLAAGNEAGTISLWEVASGKELRQLRGHEREVRSVVFSPDGKVLASCCFDGVILLWDPQSGKQRGRLGGTAAAGHQPLHVMDVAFSPDGKMLASAETPFANGGQEPWRESITLWELATGQMRLHLAGHQGLVSTVAFAGDNRTLISGSSDTTALVWDVTAPLRPRQAGSLSRKELETLWADLRSPEAPRAYRAICTLAGCPESVPFLGKHLTPSRADPSRIAQLIRDLDSDQFTVREKASAELARLPEAEPALRQALEASTSAERRRRLTRLVKNLAGQSLRVQRALEVLELMATPEAKHLLRSLARGAEAWQSHQARQSSNDSRSGPGVGPDTQTR
jgi:WD40 repeat protein